MIRAGCFSYAVKLQLETDLRSDAFSGGLMRNSLDQKDRGSREVGRYRLDWYPMVLEVLAV